MKSFITLILTVVFYQLDYSQTIIPLQHCKCEDYFEQTEPTLNGNYKRICNKKTIEEGKFINGNKDGIWKGGPLDSRSGRSLQFSSVRYDGMYRAEGSVLMAPRFGLVMILTHICKR